jgi:hypothetical protein
MLQTAAERVGSQRASLPALPNGSELMPDVRAVQAMLIGYAIECALKGLWIKGGNQIVTNDKFRGVPGVGDHELRSLAVTTGETFTRNELIMLDRLAAFVKFAGRYPIATTPEQMKMKRIADGSRAVPRFMSEKDLNQATAVLAHALSALRYQLYSIPPPSSST